MDDAQLRHTHIHLLLTNLHDCGIISSQLLYITTDLNVNAVKSTYTTGVGRRITQENINYNISACNIYTINTILMVLT